MRIPYKDSKCYDVCVSWMLVHFVECLKVECWHKTWNFKRDKKFANFEFRKFEFHFFQNFECRVSISPSSNYIYIRTHISNWKWDVDTEPEISKERAADTQSYLISLLISHIPKIRKFWISQIWISFFQNFEILSVRSIIYLYIHKSLTNT